MARGQSEDQDWRIGTPITRERAIAKLAESKLYQSLATDPTDTRIPHETLPGLFCLEYGRKDGKSSEGEWQRQYIRNDDITIDEQFDMQDGKRSRLAYHFFAEKAGKPKPFPAAVWSHDCHNSLCCNPDHGEWVTEEENKQRRCWSSDVSQGEREEAWVYIVRGEDPFEIANKMGISYIETAKLKYLYNHLDAAGVEVVIPRGCPY